MAGQRLCALQSIPDGEARGFTVETAAGPEDILVHREGDVVRGYVNSCPHVGSPLDWAPDRFIAPDGFHLMCATHGARAHRRCGRDLRRLSCTHCPPGSKR
jgi:nitrite reductase/ring-hydroxylating ferredoxin subunit